MLIARQRGISLIELIIGIAILGIILGAGVPAYTTWIANSRVHNAAEALLNGLQLARAEALSRNTRVQLTLNADSGWTIGCVTATAECPATIQTRPGAEGSANLTLSITLADATTTAGPASIAFDALGRPAGANPIVRVDLDVPTTVLAAADSRELRLLIAAAGQARMCDPYFSSSDPQGCPP